jgi:drug/metabolite transporter (DMT)-like permease
MPPIPCGTTIIYPWLAARTDRPAWPVSTAEPGRDHVVLGEAVSLAVYFLLSAAAGEAVLPPLVMAWGGLCVSAAFLAVARGTGVLPVTAHAGDAEILHRHLSWIVSVLELSLVAAVIAYVAGMAAARRLGARLASFTGMAEVAFAVLYAWLLLGQPRILERPQP